MFVAVAIVTLVTLLCDNIALASDADILEFNISQEEVRLTTQIDCVERHTIDTVKLSA